MRQLWVAVVVLAAFLGLPWGTLVEGETSSTFNHQGSDTDQFTVNFENSDYKEYNTTITYPAEEVMSVALDVSPQLYKGEYAQEVWLDVRNNSNDDWGYAGTGYGRFGLQDEFDHGRRSHTYSFPEGGGVEQIDILLPANASLTDASLKLSGRPAGSDEFQKGVLASVPTNEGSYSYYPATAVDDAGNLHVLWTDKGDLLENGNAHYDIFYRNWDGSQWSDIQQLSTHTAGSSFVIYRSAIAVEGSYVYALWEGYRLVNSSYRYTLDFAVSDDGGETFGKPVNVGHDDSARKYWPTIAAINDEVYAAWYAYGDYDGEGNDYDILFRASRDNGETWGNISLISEGANDGYYSQFPSLALGGSTLFITWEDNGTHDGESSDWDAILRSSSDGGSTWSTPSVVSSTNDNVDFPRVAAADANNVHVAWQEYDTTDSVYEIRYRSSSNGGTTWSTEQTLTDSDTDLRPQLPAIAVQGNDIYVAWQQNDADTLEPQIKLRASSNGGSSFNAGQIVDMQEYSRIRDSVALALTSDGGLWAAWIDEQQLRQADGSGWVGSERDVWVRKASSGAGSWEDPLVASEHWYEADSYQPVIRVDDQGNYYLVYWDSGDYNGNGNILHSQSDGDFFFTSSTDGGQSWSAPFVLTQREGDARSYGNNYAYSPGLAVGPEGLVYVAWYEYDYNGTDGYYNKVYFRKSSDYGQSWGPVSLLDTGSSTFSYPRLAAEGDNVYYAARKYDGSWTLTYKRSTDQGESWSGSQTMASNYVDYISLEAQGETVVLGWYYSGYSYYRVSTDSGVSFTDEEQVPSDGNTYEPMFSLDGSNLYLVFRGRQGNNDSYYDAVFMRSNDTGGSWEAPVMVSAGDESRSINAYPAIDGDEGLLYVTYYFYNSDEFQYDVYMAYSTDYGDTWEPPIPISNESNQVNLQTSFPANIAVGGQALFAWTFYEYTNGSWHYQVWTRATTGAIYPSDLTLDVGVDGAEEWSHNGELNRDNSPQSLSGADFLEALEAAIAAAKSEGRTLVDKYGVEMAPITLEATSGSEGRLLLHELAITYDVTLTASTTKLERAFQKVVDNTPEEQEAATARLRVRSTSVGGVRLSNLVLVTADADLTLTDFGYEGELKEGRDLTLRAYVANTGDSPADVTVTFWKDTSPTASYDNDLGKRVDEVLVQDVPTDGNRVAVQGEWRNLPVGDYYLFATITSSSPEDSTPDNNEQSLSASVQPTFPDIEVESLTFEDELVEGQTVSGTVTLVNQGEKAGVVDLELYEEQASGLPFHELAGFQVAAGGSYPVNFDWQVSEVEGLVVAWSVDGGAQETYTAAVNVLALPRFELVNLSWEPTAVSENTRVDFNVTWDYLGGMAVRATVGLKLVKGGDEATIFFKVGQPFEPGERLTFADDFLFKEQDSNFNDFYGEYTLVASVSDIEPQDNRYETAWNSQDLAFEDESHTLRVASPPDLDLTSLNIEGTLKEDGDVEVVVTIANRGESGATFTLKLFTYLKDKPSNVVTVSQDLSISGYDTQTYKLAYHIPENQVGQYTFLVKIDNIQPAESTEAYGAKEQSTDVDIAGSIDIPPSSKDSSKLFLLLGLVAALGAVMLGGGLVIMRSTKSKPGAQEGVGAPAGAGQPPAAQPPGGPAAPAPAAAPPAVAGAGAAMAAPSAAPGPPASMAAAQPQPAAVQPVTIQCPTCQTSLKITSAQRPIVVACPSCSTKLKLEH